MNTHQNVHKNKNRNLDFKKEWRYIYILKIDNRGNKSKFFGHRDIYYVGETDNIVRRIKQHLTKSNSGFLRKNFPDAQIKLVFLDYLYGDEIKAIAEETKIKKKPRPQKENLINSGRNKLVAYYPMKVIIAKKPKKDGEIAFRW